MAEGLKSLKRFCILVAFFFLFPAIIFADPPKEEFSLKSSVDKAQLSQGQTFTLRIEISGLFEKSSEIKLPDFKKDFEIISSGQSQNISISEKGKNQKMILEYILSPKKTGKITIGEVQVNYLGKIYKTEPIDIEVSPSKKEPQPSTPQEEENPTDEEQTTII